ncbi:MAG: hypothetical protein JSV42_15825 [Chloroflexota bacterium]|nr:MAG: hypothetical protein JSV42_15825 [Chloroflexota bacterium]
MNTETKQRFIGRKIWYGIAIALCVLVIVISLTAVAGTWVLGSTLSSITSRVLLVVENTANGLSTIVERIDLEVAEIEEITTEMSDATSQIGQNVTDKGLILALLPEEREQNLSAGAEELKQNINSTGEALENGLELYRSIDSLPFVSLPKPDQQSLARLDESIAEVQGTIQDITQEIQDFRDGLSENIGKVAALLDDITAKLVEVRQNLAQIGNNLKALQDLVARWRSMIPLLFTSLSIIVTLLFAWLIYTQVEIIRLYVQRWKGINGEDFKTFSEKEAKDSELSGTLDSEVQEEELSKQSQ